MLHVLLAALAVQGTVLADRDGDGAVSPGDEPLAGAVVAWEASVFTRTDARGRFALSAPAAGIVWVSAPDGYAPTPAWSEVKGPARDLTLLVRPLRAEGPLVFVHASDTHVGTNKAEETGRALLQATGGEPAPWFWVVTGDLTAGSKAREFDGFEEARRGIAVPLVPVAGNHDWHDGGALYRRHFGPPMYSFEAGGVHFVVLSFVTEEAARLDFVDRDLAAAAHRDPLVAFLHGPPSDAEAAALASRGVDYLFTGHAHSNRVIDRGGGLVEINTQPAVMGGLDYAPAGYRVVRLVGGRLELEHHTVVREPVVALGFPREGDRVAAGRLEIIAAVELGHRPASVTASVDGGPAVALAPGGGWTWTGAVEVGAGAHRVEVRAQSAAGLVQAAASRFTAGAARPVRGELASWPQLQGSSEHRGFQARVIAGPLTTVWARPAGAHIRGAPVVAGGRLFVPLVDLADTRRGGLVAFEARTGERLWQHRGDGSVASSPAVAGDLVVYATTDGWLHARAVADGAPRWKVQVAAGLEARESTLHAAPVIAGGRVYVGVPKRFVAVDLRSGQVRASLSTDAKPAPVFSSAAVSAGRGVVVLGRGKGSLVGFDPDTLGLTWTRDVMPVSTWVNPAPVLDDRTAYVGNAEELFAALEPADGRQRWSRKLYESHSWALWSLATPALAHETLFVATPRAHLYAVSATDGKQRWSAALKEISSIHPVPYRIKAKGFLASPVVTGDVVWAGGMDGVLRAYGAEDGKQRWSTDLGVPIVGGVVPAGPLLFVVTYDGTVRAMTPPPSPRAFRWWLLAAGILAALAAAALVWRLVGRRLRARFARLRLQEPGWRGPA